MNTKYESLKNRLTEIYARLLEQYENDIESGIEDGTYKEKDNIETRKLIKEAKLLMKDFLAYQPAVYMYVQGGQIQGMSATEYVRILKFDKEDFEASTEPYINGTPESWDKMVTEKTGNSEIKIIY